MEKEGLKGAESIVLSFICKPYFMNWDQLSFLQSKSNAGNRVDDVHTDLAGETELTFTDKTSDDVDLIFFCAGHGEAIKFLSQNNIPSHIKLIDVGNDFRLIKDSVQGNRTFVYGLPEAFRDKTMGAQNVANPGCFATTIGLFGGEPVNCIILLLINPFMECCCEL